MLDAGEIAAHLDTVQAFADAGMVCLERPQIVVLDRDGLEVESHH